MVKAMEPTKRELDVLRLLAQGYTAKRISNDINVSSTTVITHIEHLKKKFGCTKIADLIYKTTKLGLI